jgi:hypothetical protein
MESFGAMNSDKSDGILLQALQHAGGQFRAMQELLGNLRGENCLLCEDNLQVTTPSQPWEKPQQGAQELQAYKDGSHRCPYSV